MGQAPYTAQQGLIDPSAKPLRGFGGAGVLEIVAAHAIYTVRFKGCVYVLHAFQKKSKKGIATPKQEIELIRRRLADAERDYRERQN